MTRRSLRSTVLVAAALAVATASPPPPARAGSDSMPSPKYYENKLVGFRFRPMNDWAVNPPGTDTNDPHVGGFYAGKAKFNRTIAPDCELYAFKLASRDVATGEAPAAPPPSEKPPTPEEQMAEARASMYPKSLLAVVEAAKQRGEDAAAQLAARTADKDKKKKKDDASAPGVVTPRESKEKEFGGEKGGWIEAEYPIPITNGEIWRMKVVGAWIRNDDYEVGVVYSTPESQWKGYEKGFRASCATLRFLSDADIQEARGDLQDALKAAKTADDRWVAEMKAKVPPGWGYVQTRNYFFVYDEKVEPDRVRLITLQIEALRKDVYEVLFPPDRPITAICVVRVCKDSNQYSQYGGPGGSAGYWNPGAKELVFYEDTSQKRDAFRVLNHEAFHQYIHYSAGSMAPHDWFNEGHGDYFAGFNVNKYNGKFEAAPFNWRTSVIKTAMSSKAYVPLKRFVTYTRQQYYGPQIGQNYAQGWSMIWFLRQQPKNSEWKEILPTYFNTLKGEVTRYVNEQIEGMKAANNWKEGTEVMVPESVAERAKELALKAAFGAFDDKRWERFEKHWLDFKY